QKAKTSGRRSRYANRKKDVDAAFAEGKEPAAVCAQFPELPRATIYDWHKKKQQQEAEVNNVIRLVSSDAPTDPAAECRWVRGVLRRHILHPETSPAVVAQLTNTYLRSLQIEGALPKEEEDEQLADSERIDRINKLFDSARARRVGQALEETDGPMV
ncbi:MAG: hypothetical protein ACRC8Y_20695, partial [Chroococcales cyanobacterium]